MPFGFSTRRFRKANSLGDVDLKDAGARYRKLGTELREAGLRGVRAAAQRLVQTIVSTIVPSRTPQPLDRGFYRAGWKSVPTPRGADVYNAEPHAPFIEHGVRGSNVKIGAAMIRALAAWVARKRIAVGAEALSVAWSIAKSMQRRGIFRGGSGFKILEEANRAYARRFVAEEVAREIARIAGN